MTSLTHVPASAGRTFGNVLPSVLSSEASDGELGTSSDGECMGCIGVGPKGSQDPCLDSVIS